MWSALSLSLSDKQTKIEIHKKKTKEDKEEEWEWEFIRRTLLPTVSGNKIPPLVFVAATALSTRTLSIRGINFFTALIVLLCRWWVVASLLFPRKEVLISDGRLTKNFFFFNFFSQKQQKLFFCWESLSKRITRARTRTTRARFLSLLVLSAA